MSSFAAKNEVEDDKVDGFDYDFKVHKNGFVIVYIHGSCLKNGREGARAGIGVWFGDDHPLNCSEPVTGRATNNAAEMQAAVRALEIAKNEGVKNIVIRTHLKYVIKCVTEWITQWVENDWITIEGYPVENQEYIILLSQYMYRMNVKWEYVPKDQEHNGNKMAKLLSRKGAEKYVPDD